MKLPVIKHLYRNNDRDSLEKTVAVLESFSEHRSVSDQEMDLVGELITNLFGAMEMHEMVAKGLSEREAANGFVQKVMGAIDG